LYKPATKENPSSFYPGTGDAEGIIVQWDILI
jgi:hypothetical protein